jgi:predicted metalloendopeptidase
MKRSEFKVTESIRPGEDFFLYSNKYWIDNNPMPIDKVRYAAFDKLHEENLERLMELVDKPCSTLPIPLQMNIINIRNKYLERDYLENFKFIQEEYLDEIYRLSSFKEIMYLHASWIGKGIRFLFNISLDADLKDCDNNIIYISQDGLSINKDYYENDKIKNQLMKYIEKLMKKVTNHNLDSKLLGISKIEDRLASFSYTETQMRDVEMSSNIFSFTSLVSEYPFIPWKVAFPKG